MRFEEPYVALPGGLVLRSRSISAAYPLGYALRVHVEGVPVPFDLHDEDATTLRRYLHRRADHPQARPAAARVSQEPQADWDDVIALDDGGSSNGQQTAWGQVAHEEAS